MIKLTISFLDKEGKEVFSIKDEFADFKEATRIADITMGIIESETVFSYKIS
jgi:hypothetical protein